MTLNFPSDFSFLQLTSSRLQHQISVINMIDSGSCVIVQVSPVEGNMCRKVNHITFVLSGFQEPTDGEAAEQRSTDITAILLLFSSQWICLVLYVLSTATQTLHTPPPIIPLTCIMSAHVQCQHT